MQLHRCSYLLGRRFPDQNFSQIEQSSLIRVGVRAWYLGRPHPSSLSGVSAPIDRIQADPLALAVVNGEVRLRPADAETTTEVAAAAATMVEEDLDPDSLALRFGRQDVLSRAEAVKLLRQVQARTQVSVASLLLQPSLHVF